MFKTRFSVIILICLSIGIGAHVYKMTCSYDEVKLAKPLTQCVIRDQPKNLYDELNFSQPFYQVRQHRSLTQVAQHILADLEISHRPSPYTCTRFYLDTFAVNASALKTLVFESQTRLQESQVWEMLTTQWPSFHTLMIGYAYHQYQSHYRYVMIASPDHLRWHYLAKCLTYEMLDKTNTFTLSISNLFSNPYAILMNTQHQFYHIPLRQKYTDTKYTQYQIPLDRHLLKQSDTWSMEILGYQHYDQDLKMLGQVKFQLHPSKDQCRWDLIQELVPSPKMINHLPLSLQTQSAFQWVQALRHTYHLPPLVLSNQLNQVATQYSQSMLTHQHLTHQLHQQNIIQRLNLAKVSYSRYAENIVQDHDLWQAQQQLNHSLGHLKNYLEPSFTHIGIGIAKTQEKVFMTHILIQKP